ILFVLLVLDHAQFTHASLVFDTVILTVTMSIILHGLTALPGVSAYAAVLKICERRGDDLSSEQKPVSIMPLRFSPTKGQGRPTAE
ncbi:MAG: hypothetical protein KZQ73_15220, partial [Candidatus Thiodiazotropha sp. (ex Semelilucina semeliformis)]|nr:hypothetical protein [Candidatus Thiodiazotropha sp. (ex Semelilucina semeliformis)]